MQFTLTTDTLLAMAEAMIGEDKIFDPATMFMGLYTAGPDPTPPNADTDFTFPALAAFTRKSFVTWSVGDLQPDGSVQYTSPVLDFSFTTFTAPTNFIGAYIADAATANATVKAWLVFDDLVQFLSVGSHAKFVCRFTLFLDSTYRLDIIRVDGE